MNVVLFSPHFPPNYTLFGERLKELGAVVLGIGDAPYDSLKQALRESMTEYYRIDSMGDYDQALRACGYFTHIYGKLDRIESHNDHWLETDARLRLDFNITGLKPDDLIPLTHKSVMKRVFQQAGILVPRGRLRADRQSVTAFVEEVGLPIVAKPDRGVGAANTFLIRDPEELEAFLNWTPPVPYILEEFIRGELLSFDGLTDRDGEISFCTAHVFSQGVMETVNEDRDIFYYSLIEIPPALEAAGRNAVRAFDIRERFFHIEFFRTEDDRYVALEVNPRPPGGLTMDMFDFANNIDLYRGWAEIVTTGAFSQICRRTYMCAYVGRKFNKPYRHSHGEIVHALGAKIVYNGPIESVFSQAIGNYAYLINVTTREEVIDAAAFIQKLQ